MSRSRCRPSARTRSPSGSTSTRKLDALEEDRAERADPRLPRSIPGLGVLELAVADARAARDRVRQRIRQADLGRDLPEVDAVVADVQLLEADRPEARVRHLEESGSDRGGGRSRSQNDRLSDVEPPNCFGSATNKPSLELPSVSSSGALGIPVTRRPFSSRLAVDLEAAQPRARAATEPAHRGA